MIECIIYKDCADFEARIFKWHNGRREVQYAEDGEKVLNVKRGVLSPLNE